ncbi:hypothetical protein [Nocardiopsis sp. ATB16-24]|uniref:hypothetical protein n=1 Tax=Nocardiopsis sp. ATB16-24 TaxID=3019555 RepID=UPI00255726B7|nr:hypothetical protein [Nocardiopsis sp. ATB16-24]
MEAIGVPWFIAIRQLGPPLLLLAVGGALVVWRRPARPGLVWAALATQLVAAGLPYLWITSQILTDQAEKTVYGLVMTLLQPLVAMVAWALLLVAALAPPPASVGGPRRVRGDRGARGATEEGAGETERTPENIG